MSQCRCEDEACRQEKELVEPCRTEVEEELALDRVLTCTTATYICRAEPACHTALQYYNNYCSDMFTGEAPYHPSSYPTETKP